MTPPDAQQPNEWAATQAAALRFLSIREHSRAELRRKLKGRAADALIDDILDDLGERGLQSDTRYAEGQVRLRLEKGQGPLLIRRDLGQTGIDPELIKAALADAAPDWPALLQALVKRKFGPEPPADYREATRRARFLAQRGFDAEMIRRELFSDL
jgi:regulatory protein